MPRSQMNAWPMGAHWTGDGRPINEKMRKLKQPFSRLSRLALEFREMIWATCVSRRRLRTYFRSSQGHIIFKLSTRIKERICVYERVSDQTESYNETFNLPHVRQPHLRQRSAKTQCNNSSTKHAAIFLKDLSYPLFLISTEFKTLHWGSEIEEEFITTRYPRAGEPQQYTAAIGNIFTLDGSPANESDSAGEVEGKVQPALNVNGSRGGVGGLSRLLDKTMLIILQARWINTRAFGSVRPTSMRWQQLTTFGIVPAEGL